MKNKINGVRYPGQAIRRWLEEHKLSQAWLARTMNRPQKTLCEIIKHKSAMTAQTALEVEKVTGINAEFLLKLQNNLDLDKVKKP